MSTSTTLAPVAGDASTPVLAAPDRTSAVARLRAALDDHHGVAVALQGPGSALAEWTAADDHHDLDLWVPADGLHAVRAALRTVGAVHVGAAHDPRRLRHEQWWLPSAGRAAVVDITVGDLRVGPLLLATEGEVAVSGAGASLPRLTGTAAALDLFVRPLLRGRVVGGARLAEARTAWAAAAPAARRQSADRLATALGRRLATEVVAVLEGATADQALAPRARRRLALASLAPRRIGATWADRRSIIPARHRSPLGFRRRGVVVALVGTDGSGKSTVGDALGTTLVQLGYRVEHAYFGMARGNLPGVGLVRRLARGSDAAAVAPQRHPEAQATAGTTTGAPVSLARRVGAWVYAADYAWRAATRLWPARRRGSVVICDRWVSDLRRSPAPGHPASRLAELLVGAPDVLALADAPTDVIAARKAERTPAEITAEQGALRGLVAELDGQRSALRRRPACRALTVPTDGSVADATWRLVAEVVAAVHR